MEKAVIVFSPGAKSFEKFDNEFDRGRAFKAVVDRQLPNR
jgi:UDP-N-acetylmuramoylalanine-D-glutamate ligase